MLRVTYADGRTLVGPETFFDMETGEFDIPDHYGGMVTTEQKGNADPRRGPGY